MSAICAQLASGEAALNNLRGVLASASAKVSTGRICAGFWTPAAPMPLHTHGGPASKNLHTSGHPARRLATPIEPCSVQRLMKRHPRLYSAQDQGIERETVAIFTLAVVLGASRSSFLLVGFRIVLTDDSCCRSSASVARVRSVQTVVVSTPLLNCVAAWRSAGLERIMNFSNSTIRKNRIPPPTSQGQTQSGSDSLPKIAWNGGA